MKYIWVHILWGGIARKLYFEWTHFIWIYLWMFVEGKLIWMFFNTKFNSCLSCTDVSWREVLHECLYEKGIYFAYRNCNLQFCSPADLKYHMDVFMRREIKLINNKFCLIKSINPFIPGVWKPCSAWGGASGAPRVKSQHRGLPDDPMPYNGNYILCLGIS